MGMTYVSLIRKRFDMFTVYTYFGRTLETFAIGPNETHHNAMRKARDFLLSYEKETGNPAWIKHK